MGLLPFCHYVSPPASFLLITHCRLSFLSFLLSSFSFLFLFLSISFLQLAPPPFAPSSHLFFLTMVQNNQEYRLTYWATRSSVCLFACTAHSFACSALIALLTRSATLIHLPARSLAPPCPLRRRAPLRSLHVFPSSWKSE